LANPAHFGLRKHKKELGELQQALHDLAGQILNATTEKQLSEIDHVAALWRMLFAPKGLHVEQIWKIIAEELWVWKSNKNHPEPLFSKGAYAVAWLSGTDKV